MLAAHLGYSLGASKAVVVRLPAGSALRQVLLLPQDGSQPVELSPGPVEEVAGWSIGPFSRVELPGELAPGRYAVRATTADGRSGACEPFTVEPDRLQRQTMSDVLAYFRAMRSSGEIDRKDRRAAFWGDESGATVDARGGWLDASGDTSKFLSHLTYTREMSPQQIPLCAWAMMAAADEIAQTHPALTRSLGARLRDEALWGADFLVRFRSDEGYFYTGIFDALTKRLDERVVTAPLPECVRTDRYQAAYRQGGGMAIAALARAATLDDDGDFSRADYLAAARQGFDHLEEHNLDYLHDGVESIVDDYTALMAATELVAAGVDAVAAAERRARSLIGRHEWFVHAVEAGLPVLALLRFADVLPDSLLACQARPVAVRVMLDLLERSRSVANPFGYPRQREAFFYPHDNETGYWWQGENATIASLSAAASACARLDEVGEADRRRLDAFADDQLAWITGRNPFDTCMIQGRGRNNVDYASDFPNLPGGIVNGITSGWSDEDDIAFLPADAPPGESWRWAEQWIPHAGWFLLAVASARS
ncbi:glycoside hydrolase family 9 protein [Nonomuraea sp. NPDC050556]|uniref:glycoside hydrolase family 9 protein n=1 Tax=Nonomuraea sp. NPDC050556 TaxID=3364369 RepID=UPI0037AB90D5